MDFSKAFKRLIMLARNKNSSERGAQSGGAGLSVSITVMPDFFVWFIGVRSLLF